MRCSFALVPFLVVWSLACGGVAEDDEPVTDEPPADIIVDTGLSEEPAPPPRRRRRPPPANPSPAPADPAPVEPAPAPGEGDEAPDDDEDDGGAKRDPAPKPAGITQLSKTTWQLRRNLADQYKDDPYLLANNVQKSGDGWEVKGVRQKDAYHLGIRSKDVVLEVNGKKLKTDAQLLAAWLALKNKDAYDVVLIRNGQTRVHHYEIVD